MPRIALLFSAFVAFSAPVTARAEAILRTADGFTYDVIDEEGGQVARGGEVSGSFPYRDAYALAVSVVGASPQCYSTGNRLGARGPGGELTLNTFTVPGSQVRVWRRIWVPSAGGEFIRYVDAFRNDGVVSVRVAASIVGDLGVNGANVRLTADRVLNDPALRNRQRDAAPETDDVWILQDDDDAEGIPSLVHVLQGWDAGAPGGAIKPDCIAIPYDAATDACDGAVRDPCGAGLGASGFRWDYEFDVAPGQTVALLTFGLQGPTRDAAVGEAERIVNLPDDVLLHLPESLREGILNFDVGGAPRIVLEAPASVDEGEAIVVRAAVDDLEDDAVTWSWDLPLRDNQGDGDGTFGESPGATEVVVPADITNGPLDFKIRLRAVESADPTKVRTRTAVVRVRNVAPVIESLPPTPRLFVGDTYRYEVVVEDAPGESGAIGYVLRAAPTGMTRRPDPADPFKGIVEWTVGPEHRGMTHQVVLEVSDDGGDRSTQTWELFVENNLRPLPPVPVFPTDITMPLADRQPTFVVENGEDPEGDALELFIRVTPSVTDFATEAWVGGVDRYESGGIAQSPSGQTSWPLPMVLRPPSAEPRVPGTYFWEAYVVDALGARSESRYASFSVRNPAPPDGGTRRPRMEGDDGGCATAPLAAGGQGLFALTAAALVLSLRRRRR